MQVDNQLQTTGRDNRPKNYCTYILWLCVLRLPQCRYGKVLWRSDGRGCVSDEVLMGRYKIKDLEKGGMMSVEDELGRRGIRWEFPTV